ncbi:MAG: SBBP repeat-containing protein [Bryobacteraceae bacterium]|nr:SBBP repeat-containing protein [Bryobacteraceae bacterium]MDW8377026.1 SBBP repeat-containing protein [Bryobacterales bacterium]
MTAGALRYLPTWFEPNLGQYRQSVRYFSRGGQGAWLVEAKRATLAAGQQGVTFEWMNALEAELKPGPQLPSRSQYFLGSDRSKWIPSVPQFASVHGKGLYPGIDVVYYFQDAKPEFDLILAPYANPDQIRFRLGGALRLTKAGQDLRIFGPVGELKLQAPMAYQYRNGEKTLVPAEFLVEKDGLVRFSIGAYDRSQQLVIDPIVSAGYFGSDTDGVGNAVAVDSRGGVWVAGYSGNIVPLGSTPQPLQAEPGGGRDAFLAKFERTASGTLVLRYWTLFGGGADDTAYDLTVDDRGFVYLTGSTQSINFPVAGPPLQNGLGGETDAFVAVLRPEDPDGIYVWYGSYFGGSGRDEGYAVTIDEAGAIYFGGSTRSPSLPGTDANVQCCGRGGFDAFVVKAVPGSSSPLAYSTYFGGDRTEILTDLALDPSGNVYFTGYTASSDFPVTEAPLRDRPPQAIDIFLVKIDMRRPGLDGLLRAIYLGGDGVDVANSMAVTPEGKVWLAGYTFSNDLPLTPGSYRTQRAGDADAVILRVDLDNVANPIEYATLLGGRAADVIYALQLLAGGRLALAGYTFSPDFPIVDSAPAARLRPGTSDAFVAVLDPNVRGAASLTFSQVFGGTLSDWASDVAADALGNLYVTGGATSRDLPVTDGTFKIAPGGAAQGFLLQAVPPAGR